MAFIMLGKGIYYVELIELPVMRNIYQSNLSKMAQIMDRFKHTIFTLFISLL